MAVVLYPVTQPPRAAKIKITLTGSPCVGSVTVTGTLSGTAVTETISFTIPATKTSSKMWDIITSFTVTGIAPTVTISVDVVDALNQPIKWLVEESECPCVFSTLGGLQSMIQAKELGLTNTEVHYCRIDADVPITVGSEFTIIGINDVFVPASSISLVSPPGDDTVIEKEFYAVKR